MKIHHIRNATMALEINNNVLLVDPMLGSKGTILPFAFVRFKAKKNPIVSLPSSTDAILERVTHCIVTHQHPDHLDGKGTQFLREKEIPVVCSTKDEKGLRKNGLNVVQTLSYWETANILSGKITGIPARHGYGLVTKIMGNVMGFYLDLAGEPSIYLSADTIYTKVVEKIFTEIKPDISVAACGAAQLDIFSPLLMNMDDMLKFIEDAPGKVIANHMEALNHCPTSRKQLK